MQGVEERERKKIPAKGEGGRCEVEEEQVCGRETCIYGCVCFREVYEGYSTRGGRGEV